MVKRVYREAELGCFLRSAPSALKRLFYKIVQTFAHLCLEMSKATYSGFLVCSRVKFVALIALRNDIGCPHKLEVQSDRTVAITTDNGANVKAVQLTAYVSLLT